MAEKKSVQKSDQISEAEIDQTGIQQDVVKDKPAPASPCTMVIFGAHGDLTKRKLIPALYYLAKDGLLDEQFSVLGVDHIEGNDDSFRKHLDESIREFVGDKLSAAVWSSMQVKIHYLQGDFKQDESFTNLGERLEKIAGKLNIPQNYLFYMATPPRFFSEIARRLHGAGLATEPENQWRRLVIEKPFGQDLQSALVLNKNLHEAFKEYQIYRIDHYLGKETVQNILMYRLANSTVEPIWNHRYIDHVQITVAETVGVENRAGYYDQSGALRDMVANHLLALLSVVAMEPANALNGEAIRDEQSKILKSVQILEPEEVLTRTVRGQYDAGVNPVGDSMPAYRDEPGVMEGSKTDTYVALKLIIDSWRWADVPFYLRTGKRMAGRYTEIAIQFKHAPNMAFKDSLVKRANIPPNVLVLRIQPDEGIGMCFNTKVPSPIPQLSPVEMDFSYSDYFGQAPATGYETLIYDCMCGDQTLFKRADNIETGWAIVEPIIDVWSALTPRHFPNYAAGSWGPDEADELLHKDGRSWRKCHPIKKT